MRLKNKTHRVVILCLMFWIRRRSALTLRGRYELHRWKVVRGGAARAGSSSILVTVNGEQVVEHGSEGLHNCIIFEWSFLGPALENLEQRDRREYDMRVAEEEVRGGS